MVLILCVLISLIFLIQNSFVEAVAPKDSVKVFVKGEGGYYCHKIPYLFRTKSNVLLAFAEGRGANGRSACDDFAGTDLVYKRSFDNGMTWSPLKLFYSNSSDIESNVIGNAAPVQVSSTGRIYVPFCKNNEIVFISYSDDDGATWSEPVYHPELILNGWKWVGLGPPGGIELESGRLLVPGYHTNLIKGDGLLSYGHTIYSDDHGLTWSLGSVEFGRPYLSNECQAIQLKNNSILINARTVTNNRIQVISNDEGMTFEHPYVVDTLTQSFEGCEGSIIRNKQTNKLYFSDPISKSLTRLNMTIFESIDEGLTWKSLYTVDEGAVAYSSLQLLPNNLGIELLYERSDEINLVFEPLEIVYIQYKQ